MRFVRILYVFLFRSVLLLPSFRSGRAVCQWRRCMTGKARRQMSKHLSPPRLPDPSASPSPLSPALNPVKAGKATSKPCADLSARTTHRRGTYAAAAVSISIGERLLAFRRRFLPRCFLFLPPGRDPPREDQRKKKLTEAAIRGPSPCIVPPIRALTLTVLFYGLGRRPLARSSWPWHPVPRAEQLPLQRVHHVHNAPSAGRCPLASRNQPSIQQIANCKRGARFRPHSVSRRWH